MTKNLENENEVSLKEYIESKLDDMNKATTIALTTLDKRLDGMNEFRDTLKDQNATFATKEEISNTIDPMKNDIESFKEYRAVSNAKASQFSLNITTIIALSGLTIALINLILHVTGH